MTKSFYNVIIGVTGEIVSDLMVSVIESSYSPWVDEIDLEGYGKANTYENPHLKFKVKFDREKDQEGSFKGRKTLTDRDIQKGLQVMAREYPRHFADIITDGGWDAITADIFFQCVVFGKVIYG